MSDIETVITSLGREVTRLTAENANLTAQLAKVTGERDRARDGLRFALEEMRDMLPYVDSYFQEKWGYPASIAKVERLLTEGVWEPES